MTKTDSNLRADVTQRDAFKIGVNENLEEKIEYGLTRIFERELLLIDKFFEIASEIKMFDNFNVYQAFRMIDYFNTNYIDERGYITLLMKV